MVFLHFLNKIKKAADAAFSVYIILLVSRNGGNIQ